MMDKENPCRNCIHSTEGRFIDIDGSGRHDYYEGGDCDYDDDCYEGNGFKGWQEVIQ